MNWKTKALIQKLCGALPLGELLYQTIQLKFGGLSAGYDARALQFRKLVCDLAKHDIRVQDASLLELGTGHIPRVPLLLCILGARKTVTVDLHKRLQKELTIETIKKILSDREKIAGDLSEFGERETIEYNLDLMDRYQNDLDQCFEAINLHYLAPQDARALDFENGSFDCCFSITVVEHIDPSVLAELLREEKRILAPGGLIVHQVELSDHFAHSDASITKINFLKFSDRMWNFTAGNEFGYTNRLRASEVETIFRDSGLDIVSSIRKIDEASLVALATKAVVPHERWHSVNEEELCCVTLDLVARPLAAANPAAMKITENERLVQAET